MKVFTHFADFAMIDKINIFNPKYLAQQRVDKINSNIKGLLQKKEGLQGKNPIINELQDIIEPTIANILNVKTPYTKIANRIDNQYLARKMHTSYGKPIYAEQKAYDVSPITTKPTTRVLKNKKGQPFVANLNTDPVAPTVGREGQRLASVGRLNRLYGK